MNQPAQVLILNVDDQEAERYVKTRDLKSGGYDVIEATTGAEALRMVEEHRPTVVLLDVQLPDINGYEVCAFIKRKWPEVMVLQTSATFTTSAHRTLGLDAGADSYLVQPAEPFELAAAINALLRIRRSEDALRELNSGLERQIQDRTADLAATNEKLRAEMIQRQKAEEALIQAQKMEAVGQLTGGLAHDFNNLLTAVVGNLDLIRAKTSDARIGRLAENAFNAAERGAKLTAQLLAFSRTQKLVTEPVDVNRLIIGLNDLLNQSLGAGVQIETALDATLPPAMGDVNQLELAILNLSINARDAMPDGGTLRITTSIAPQNANAVMIAVADTGTGMPAHVQARAFDPFFTTKPPGKGTGLGLSQVYGIVRQIGGEVIIETKEGKGTTIFITLPRASEVVRDSQANPEEVRRSNSERILIIDDDPDVREIVSQVLIDIGYRIDNVANGDIGIAKIEASTPDLLIVDFAMPGKNGAEVAHLVRERWPTLPILFVSGFADSAALESGVGGAHILRKPFRPAELAAAVRSALDARA